MIPAIDSKRSISDVVPQTQKIETEEVEKALGKQYVGDTVEKILQDSVADREHYFVLNDEYMEAYLNGTLQDWQVFLHPDQTRGVEMDTKGPMMVTGPAGTGKSVVAVHRVRWLLRNRYPVRGRILLTTYTHTLARYAEGMLKALCTEDELSRIDVRHFDDYFHELLSQHCRRKRVVYDLMQESDFYDLVRNLMGEHYSGIKDLKFVLTEYDRVIAENAVLSIEDYLNVVRPRDLGTLKSEARTQLWPLFDAINRSVSALRSIPKSVAINLLSDVVGPRDCCYDSIVVDEAQDLGSPEYRLLAKLTGNKYDVPIPYSLFFAGDGHQRIYSRAGSLKQCGINVKGRSVRLIKCHYHPMCA